MSYYPPYAPISADRLLGNPTGSPIALPEEISLTLPIEFVGDTITAPPGPGRTTTGNTTLLLSDNNTDLISSSATPVTYTLPAGLPSGFVAGSFQEGAGQITYAAGAGATILNTATPKSAGVYTTGDYVRMEQHGGDAWIVTGSLA